MCTCVCIHTYIYIYIYANYRELEKAPVAWTPVGMEALEKVGAASKEIYV